MIQDLAIESKMISDTESEDSIMEQPVVVENNSGSDGLTLTDVYGNSIFIPYRMVLDVCKVMKQFSTKK